MASNQDSAVGIQRKYYTETAERYERMHEHETTGDEFGMKIVHSILRLIDARSVLDVGTATGRGVRDLKESLPDLFVCGVEPVAALVKQAVISGNTASSPILCGSGEALPFADASFDAVCEFAVLHHVANPNAVVKEMLRVARKAVLIADSNRFGQGAHIARLCKLALYKSGLWGAFNYLRTSGKGYQITEGDGLAYSYSVYDSLDLISQWADRVILIPSTGAKATSWFHPLLSSEGVLVCALKGF
jgi:ubiquinone/menaquinone biosynthesis C-methylase UbiE